MVGEGMDSTPRRGAAGASLLLHALLLGLLLSHFHRAKPEELRLGRVTHIELGLPAPAAASPPAPPQPRPQPRLALSRPQAPDPHGILVRAAPPVPAPVAPAAPAVPAPQASADQAAPVPWAMLVEMSRMVSIQVSRKYPPEARHDGEQGTTVVHAHLTRDGRVLDASVLTSSGFPRLDEAARALIASMHSFPALPAEYLPGRSEFYVDQPVVFRL
jgi:periplasmic protein TonB